MAMATVPQWWHPLCDDGGNLSILVRPLSEIKGGVASASCGMKRAGSSFRFVPVETADDARCSR